MKKILVISYVGLMSTSPNGRTMKSLIQGFPKDKVSCFCSIGSCDKNVAKSIYKVSNIDAKNSFLRLKEYGGVIDASEDEGSYSEQEVQKGKKCPWKYLLKELVWKFGKWNGKNLKEWLLDQKVDGVVYMYGDSSSLQDFAVYVSEFLSVPLVVYSCEDYCFKDYNYINFKDKNIPFKIYQKMSKASTEKLFKRASALVCNSDDLAEKYKEKYGINKTCTIMMASNMEFSNNITQAGSQIDITYLGSLGNVRVKPLCEIAEAIADFDNVVLNIYGEENNKENIDIMNNYANIKYHGFVSYEKVKQVMYASHLLIEAIDNDSYIKKDKRYGFSTKYADSFACGTPFFVYAPLEIIETKFALDNNCAFVAETKDKLKDVLCDAIFNEEKRLERVKNARIVTEKYFDEENNIKKFNDLIEDVCKNNK